MSTGNWAELLDWHVSRTSDVPLFRQVYLEMRGAILTRRLKAGEKLPSTRELSQALGLARGSIVAAYDQLLAEGYIDGKTGAGTFISKDLPDVVDLKPAERQRRAAPSPAVKSAYGDHPHFADTEVESETRPFTTGRTLVDARSLAVFRKLAQESFRTLDPVHRGYSDARGLKTLREAVCEYLKAARAVNCEPDQIVITAGTQHAVDIILRTLLSKGDEVWVEDPGYPMIHAALDAAGLKLHPIPVDAHGVDVARGIRLAPRARAAFVTPSHQYPLGIVLSMARRLELLEWARDNHGWIVEDDYQSEFRYSGRPLASLQGLDEGERVIYVGTFNKALFPGLRMGYAVVPRAALKAFVKARYLADRQPPTLMQTIVADFMRHGHFATHIRRMRLTYREQRDVLVAELNKRAGDRLAIEAPDQGMHLVAYLDGRASDVDLERRARQAGVIVKAISPCYRKAKPRPGLLLGFSGHPKHTIGPAAARLARVLTG